jgi:hypothetical protein
MERLICPIYNQLEIGKLIDRLFDVPAGTSEFDSLEILMYGCEKSIDDWIF